MVVFGGCALFIVRTPWCGVWTCAQFGPMRGHHAEGDCFYRVPATDGARVRSHRIRRWGRRPLRRGRRVPPRPRGLRPTPRRGSIFSQTNPGGQNSHRSVGGGPWFWNKLGSWLLTSSWSGHPPTLGPFPALPNRTCILTSSRLPLATGRPPHPAQQPAVSQSAASPSFGILYPPLGSIGFRWV